MMMSRQRRRPQKHLCGNQTTGAQRHRRDVALLDRRDSAPSTRRCRHPTHWRINSLVDSTQEEASLDSDAEEAEVQRQIAHQKELVQRDARREKKRRAKAAQKARLRRGAGIVEESNVDDATREQVFFSPKLISLVVSTR